jgi:hypothetical protein
MGGEDDRPVIWLDEAAQNAEKVWICVNCSYAMPHEPTIPLLEDLCMLWGSRMVLKRTTEATQAEGASESLKIQSKPTEFQLIA